MPDQDPIALPFPAAALRPTRADALGPWQPGAGQRIRLKELDPDARPLSQGDKAGDKARVEALAAELDGLQELFYADGRFKLLLVLQGMDTSGKDGTVRGVFSRTSPLGVHTVGWKAPTDRERAHDYLWRIHQQVPGAGEIMVFNRSHYEDVCIARVRELIPRRVWEQRYAQIVDFERMLHEEGTTILKFFLHIGREEQLERFGKRIENPKKNWKISDADYSERPLWDDYTAAYEEAFRRCSTGNAPWFVIPADRKWVRNLAIAEIVVEALEKLRMRFPEPQVDMDEIRRKYHEAEEAHDG
ncbi:MAG: polyphosphate kinase 2 family protein [Burkholderiales bacterium]|nr:MAG: polyphosphate kinase 2 family protein [Burkholderiales bacterium]